jgi:translocation and assembly module TamB
LKRSVLTNSAGHFTAGPAPLAPFAQFAPAFLVPEGRWKVDLEIAPGGRLSGALDLAGLSSRPLPPLAPLREINARLQLRERSFIFEKFTATLGGESLNLSGQIDLPKDLAVRSVLPGMNLRLTGTNLPLARKPELVVRGDLNLQITNTLGAVPLIMGEVTLKESYYLKEIRALVPGRLAKAQRRPPYFSIEQAPFDVWRLNLRVHGDRCFKIRSPLFSGVASAAFTLEGTLSEPFAFGEAILNQGTVQFPFANVRINQGLVTLARDDPFRPKVLASGTSRSFGYDIKMDVHGPADEPSIEFTSTPGLTTEQIILMLTTGEIPQSEQLFSNQQRAGKLAMFLGKSLWSKFSGGEGGAERLTIRSGEEISDQGKQTYRVEYKLTDIWALVGEYDRFGSINAGLKWKLYSR